MPARHIGDLDMGDPGNIGFQNGRNIFAFPAGMGAVVLEKSVGVTRFIQHRQYLGGCGQVKPLHVKMIDAFDNQADLALFAGGSSFITDVIDQRSALFCSVYIRQRRLR